MDEKDGKVGIVGYEINFNRYFYRYAPPRPLAEIEADIRTIEKDIMGILKLWGTLWGTFQCLSSYDGLCGRMLDHAL